MQLVPSAEYHLQVFAGLFSSVQNVLQYIRKQ